MELVEVNGETGLCVRVKEEIIAERRETIHAVCAVINPDKLPRS
jgi:hypothetical protein